MELIFSEKKILYYIGTYFTLGCEENLPYRHFMVCRPEVSVLELHPEEGQVPKLTEEIFRSLFNEVGHLEDDLTLRKYIFFSGMDRNIRKEVWPFLLHVYPYQSTYEERIQIAEIRRQVMNYIKANLFHCLFLPSLIYFLD